MRENLTGLQHIGLPVEDYGKACDFYKLLGFENIYETSQPNGLKVGFFRLGNLEMEIYEAPATAQKTGSIDHIALDCKNIGKLFDEAKANGLEIVSNGIEDLPYWDKGIRFFHVLGPAGEKVEFCEKL